MCGIIGAVANHDVAITLLDGLKRLEYRGYDSAGIAIINSAHQLERIRTAGKVKELIKLVKQHPLPGYIGIAHTRWATHGKPNEQNAHPHIAGNEIALVHNGIIENYNELRSELLANHCILTSETDSELIAHLVNLNIMLGQDLLLAVRNAAKKLKGSFAIGLIRRSEPHHLIALCNGSPLVIGIGKEETYISSDTLALLPLIHQFIFLEEGDIAEIETNQITIYNINGEKQTRPIHQSNANDSVVDKGEFPHYFLKEIFEQPSAISRTLQNKLGRNKMIIDSFGVNAPAIFKKLQRVQIVACGTSYYAGLIGKFWIEELCNIPCQVELASEYRYKTQIKEPNTLFITISQSGETADTLAALHLAKKMDYLTTLAICNVPESKLVRESNLVFLTNAGSEISVASTKSFTCQLTALLMLATSIAHYKNPSTNEALLVDLLTSLPGHVEQVLKLNPLIKKLASDFIDKSSAIFMARGIEFPVALEGALKLKEISYVHAEAFPAGEFKHGPLALVTSDMPVVVLAQSDHLIHKLESNIEEVYTRGGNLIIFADSNISLDHKKGMKIISMPSVNRLIAPIIYVIPLQLLAYHVAILKGTDVDQPRNLAKSVTVE